MLLVVVVAAFPLQSCSTAQPDPTPSNSTLPNPSPSTSSSSTSSSSTSSSPSSSTSSNVSIHVFDVGEGLAVLIDDGATEVVIDGGYAKYGKSFSNYIHRYVDGDIEYVIATHSHADHVGGLTRLYEDYQIDHTIYGDTGTSTQYKDFESAARAEPYSEFRNDVTESISLSEDVTLSIIDIIDDDKNTNNNSVIVVLDVSGIKTLITGDAEDKTEQLLFGRIGEVDIYVVGHHGSETSSSQALLDEIRPKYGIISSQGSNAGSYNNPDIEVLRRLSALGTVMYATYRSGTIVVTTDGRDISLTPPESEQITTENYREAA
ncbi:MAG: MBL fold metallo-hydrolase [Coriobacteriales bacterium]|nr:MBL fold metallo-hydrolase [Coriobacteriales bacterium]